MKYLCLGYLDEKKLDTMSERQRETLLKECFAYDNILRTNGHFVRLEGLEPAQSAILFGPGTDGPYAETKEQIGGLLLLEAKDLNHAAQLMSKHPGIRVGVFEIRAIDEPSCVQASEVGNP